MLGGFLSKDGAMSVTRLLIGVAFGAAVGGSVGLPAMVAISIGIVALTGVAHYSIEQQKKEMLLNVYHQEIAQILGKDVTSLVVEDLERVAKTDQNPSGRSTAVAMALDYFEDTRNFYIGAQTVTAGLMIAGLSVASSFGMPTLTLAGASGLLYNELFRAVTNVGSFVYDGNIEGCITRDIRSITDQISLGGRVSSTRVMGVLVAANQEIRNEIQAKYGTEYKDLSISDKRDIVNHYAHHLDVERITRDINTGRILPTELGFALFRESSGVPPREVVPDMHMVSDEHNTTRWRARATKPEPLFKPAPDYVRQLDLEESEAMLSPGIG